MRILNLCCGATRPGELWTNLDNLHASLLPGSPERWNLDEEQNYVNHDVLSGALPFPSDTFDGILASHCVEHWDCQESVRVLAECRRVLVPGGVLAVSVPNATYFRDVYDEDTEDNAIKWFGEPIFPGDGEKTFFGYGLFNRFHKQVLTEDSLWAIIRRAGFEKKIVRVSPDRPRIGETPVMDDIRQIINRRKFSLMMMATK